MGIAGTIMHQSVRAQNLTAAEHLDAEWRLFETLEAEGVSHLCRTWEATRPVVVVGRNSPVADQVILEACLRDNQCLSFRTLSWRTLRSASKRFCGDSQRR
jgi:hypothetical protein